MGALAVVLVGGLGTRIRHVLGDLPKPLAPVAGKPFLEWVLRYLRKQGVGRVRLAAGQGAPQVESFAKSLQIAGLEVSCAAEPRPLGTGGGFVYALKDLEDPVDGVLACNGDSLALADLNPLFQAISGADAAILGVRVPDTGRYGTLETTQDGRLRRFAEKRPGAGLVNAGVYLFTHLAVGGFPERQPLSFEYDVFPSLLARGMKIRVVGCDAPFLDIGTEASLAQADGFIRAHPECFA